MRAALALAACLAASAAMAQPPPEDPDWPCVQRKVPTLTPAAVWTGPAIEQDGATWREDPDVAALVQRLAQRRLPVEEAAAEVEAFAAALTPGDREAKLTALFAGLFETMDAERSAIIDGITRYARRQKALAAAIRATAAEVEAARRDPSPDAERIGQAEEALRWQTRIFNDRRASLTYVCEVPRLVEQRLFSLGRAITGAMDG